MINNVEAAFLMSPTLQIVVPSPNLFLFFVLFLIDITSLDQTKLRKPSFNMHACANRNTSIISENL